MRDLNDRKEGVACSRCGEQRWPFKQWSEPYLCGRCREALAGGHAIDPLITRSEAQNSAFEKLRKHQFGRELGGVIPEISPGDES